MQLATHSDGRPLEFDEASRELTLGGAVLTPSEVVALDKAKALNWTRYDVRETIRKAAKKGTTLGPVSEARGMSDVATGRTISETKYTCKACGRVWYWGKKDQTQNALNAVANAGDSMSPCSCCFPRPQRTVVDPTKCPNCGSRDSESELVVHEV